MSRLPVWFAFAVGSFAWAQSFQIGGHVLDPHGKSVAGASVHLLTGGDDVALMRT